MHVTQHGEWLSRGRVLVLVLLFGCNKLLQMMWLKTTDLLLHGAGAQTAKAGLGGPEAEGRRVPLPSLASGSFWELPTALGLGPPHSGLSSHHRLPCLSLSLLPVSREDA